MLKNVNKKDLKPLHTLIFLRLATNSQSLLKNTQFYVF